MQERENEEQQRSFIKIPSYQEVFEASKPQPPPSLFRPSSSSPSLPPFSEAFSFIKNSEFYTPPPAPTVSENTPRQIASAGPSSSSSSSPSVQGCNAVLVSRRQQGNPLLKHIRNARWMFADIVPDYQLGQTSCALYLSLEECGRYLETIKVYENKPADIIQERTDSDYLSRLSHALSVVRRVNKSDVVTLGSAFGSLSRVMDASMEDLARCPGIGEHKVKRLYDTFHEPFKRNVPSHPFTGSGIPAPEDPKLDEAGKSKETCGERKEEEKKGHETKEHEEPGLTVGSALAAALAKYPDKVCKEKGKGVEGVSSMAMSNKTKEGSSNEKVVE
ncbi:DNA excision repair protein ERCC-1 isoform X2 [Amborella trichopoda]|uniref:DNA excision repair protein ERCC-1 isoform X2 n=1 Tax=Amborella trichopoda TaxID=13333 RepID=UPI0009C07786|nr:DNA excision repair protein ERCC-1 isoform X2 [Amborella trichopoda]|eukprot:XP_020525875.1 DNA excision repair protein ERCC-1 isoform X2 [Amborella trichopoda]